jgi:hypothetical protein
LVASWRSTLSLPVYASDAARRFECANVGQGGSADLDPQLIAMLGGEMAQRSVAYATLVDLYKASHPDADMAARLRQKAAGRIKRKAWRSRGSRSTSRRTCPIRAW